MQGLISENAEVGDPYRVVAGLGHGAPQVMRPPRLDEGWTDFGQPARRPRQIHLKCAYAQRAEGHVVYVVEVPVEAGGRLLVEASDWQVPGELELASIEPGEVAARASESLERSLDQLGPAIGAMVNRVKAMGPDEFTVEFGLMLGAECGVIVAKGSSEVNLKVTLSWKRAG